MTEFDPQNTETTSESPDLQQSVTIQTAAPASSSVTPRELRKEVMEFVKMVAWFLVVFFLLKAYVIEGYEVQGPSMLPTLHDQERILVFKLPHILSQIGLLGSLDDLTQGDVVIFNSTIEPNKRYVKRVIAKGPYKTGNTADATANSKPPADATITVSYDRGAVYINNKKIDEKYLPATPQKTDELFSEWQVSPGEFYVLGDNRIVSKDSRSFGPVGGDRVIGKAVLRFWPLSKFGIIR